MNNRKDFSERVKTLKPSAIREILKFTADPKVISFSAGNPAPEAFPTDIIRQLSDQIFEKNPIGALQYSITEGYAPLRELIKNDLKNKNLLGDYDNVIITGGAQQAIEITTKILCNEGDTIVCEAPTFIGSLNAFRSYKPDLKGVEMDDEGMIPEQLEKVLAESKSVAFIYLIPNFQNPSGKTMSLQRRKEILRLAVKYNTIILEDNPYGELRFNGEAIPSIKELDKDNIVIYVGSFSKVLAPGLRVGYMCAEESIIQKATVALQVSTVHTNIWSQMLTYEFLTTVDFEQHLAKLRSIYKHKCELMLTNLEEKMPKSITFTHPDGGLFIWGTLPSGDMMAFCKAAVEHNVAVVPGNAFLVDENAETLSFRLNFSTPTDEQIVKGVEILAQVAKEFYS